MFSSAISKNNKMQARVHAGTQARRHTGTQARTIHEILACVEMFQRVDVGMKQFLSSLKQQTTFQTFQVIWSKLQGDNVYELLEATSDPSDLPKNLEQTLRQQCVLNPRYYAFYVV